MVPAHFTEARGRSERAFGTCRRGYTMNWPPMSESPRWRRPTAFPRGACGGVRPRAHVDRSSDRLCLRTRIGTNLHDILCLQEERVVPADDCVAYKGPPLRNSEQRIYGMLPGPDILAVANRHFRKRCRRGQGVRCIPALLSGQHDPSTHAIDFPDQQVIALYAISH